jgi:protoporphyrin/coproporphyrin ferrochelatase
MQDMKTNSTIGVLLLNLGGPEHLAEVEPFLVNLFSDRQIIRLGPRFLQKPLARLIARRRAPKSRTNYAKIGGGSPMLAISRQQAQLLEQSLREEGRYLVRVCMRYWHPRARPVLTEMQAAGVQRIVALPLYPHYSMATTGSSFRDLDSTIQALNLELPVHWVKAWPDHPLYIRSLATRIRQALQRVTGSPALVYSAHSLPSRLIDEGDPYVEHLHQTITALERETGLRGHLCYQSRSGPVEWLGPSTPDLLRRLAAQGVKSVLVVPLSFVSDHIETLYEIDMEYRALAEGLAMEFACIQGLNTEPTFIAALRDLVMTAATTEPKSENDAFEYS